MLIEDLKLIPVIPIKDTLRQKVKNKYRKEIKEIYENNKEIYKDRYKIEQLFGKIKNAYGDRDNTKSYKLASVFVQMVISLSLLERDYGYESWIMGGKTC